MKSTAWLFPGHGCQYVGMGRGFAFENKQVSRIFTLAETLSRQPLRELSRTGSTEQIRCPGVLEPLLVAFALSYSHLLNSNNQFPSVVTGYSAGIIPALHSAGAISLEDAISLACVRGRLLDELSKECPGQIITLSGQEKGQLISLIQTSGNAEQIEIAGWNSDNNISVVGPSEIISQVAVSASYKNIKATYVATAGAWHSRIAAKKFHELQEAVNEIAIEKPSIPFYSSVTGVKETCPRKIAEQLALQIHLPVMWEAALNNIEANESIQHYLEVGCGISLKGMYKPTQKSFPSPTFKNLYSHIGASYA